MRLADRSADAGDFQTAATFYQQAFDDNPQSVEALVELGRSYTGLGQYARAEQALVEAQTGGRATRRCCSSAARTQLASGQAEAALGEPRRGAPGSGRATCRSSPRGARPRPAEPARRGAGDLPARAGDRPDQLRADEQPGLSLGLSGQTGEAITILRELVRDGAATANTRGNLALVYGLAGRRREASATLAVDLSRARSRTTSPTTQLARDAAAGQADRQPRRARAGEAGVEAARQRGWQGAGRAGRRGAEARGGGPGDRAGAGRAARRRG